MRRLFWSITFSFLAVSAFIVLSFLIFITRWHEVATIPGLEVARMQIVLDGYLVNAQSELTRKGPDGLARWLDIVGNETMITVYAMDNSGRLLSKRKPPDEAIAVLANGGKELAAIPKWMRVINVAYEGRSYTLLTRVEPSLINRLLYAPVFRVVGGIGAAIGVIGALLLAWYITSPLARIQSSAYRYAHGDLDARVGRLPFGRATEIVALAGEFDRMSERIKRLVENYKSLIRDVSHELRSPLARLRIAIELARTPDPPATDTTLDRIESEANRLEHMLRQTIELAKLQMAAPLENEPVALKPLLEEIVANADFEGGTRGCRVLSTDIEAVSVMGDYEALYSALENVVRNALRYTKDGTSVEVSLKRSSPDRVSICVRDRGPGLSEQECERVFEPFYRTRSARAASNDGVGLGLAIVRSAVERHHGSICARNREEGGLEIAIVLPFATAATTESPPAFQ